MIGRLTRLIKNRFRITFASIFYFGVFLISAAIIIYCVSIVENESELGVSLIQIAPAVSEKAIYAGDELIFSLTCNCALADRWMVSLTATSNMDNVGYMTIKIDGVGEKTIRTGILNKISGTYLIPLYNKSGMKCRKEMKLYLKFSGGNKQKPLLYIAEMAKNSIIAYQIAVQPEKGYPVAMPKNAVFPRSQTQYKIDGECTLE